jgi:DNA (cytosine-5)-methyltransferase 1
MASGIPSIELFAGAGGLAIGTARAGFQHRVVLEWDRNSCDTLRLNASAPHGARSAWRVIEGDVSTYDFQQHAGQVEFVSGGPPCQPFSLGGKHLGHADERNMFPHAVRAIREIQPSAFIFENVKGLLRKGFANYYNYIIQQLQHPHLVRRGDESWENHLSRLERASTGGRARQPQYNVVYRLLNAADYGVPQHRWRVLIVGVRADLNLEFSFPDHGTHEEDALLYSQWVTGEYWERHRIPSRQRPECPPKLRKRIERLGCLFPGMMLKPWLTVRDAICDLPKIAVGKRSSKIPNHFLNPGARSYPGHTGSPLDEPAKALKAGDHGVPGGENTLRLASGEVRYFSVRECARIQTFPDNWVFSGSWTESMRQLGNAVPVKLAEVVASRLHELLNARRTEVMREAGSRRNGRVSSR